MPRYRYAHIGEEDGEVVDVFTLSHDRKDGEASYYCVGCGQLLTAKIKGEKLAKHFAHRASIRCNQETYLHRLGKRVFFDEYSRRMEQGLPFFIELSVKNHCSKYELLLGKRCALGVNTRRFDLTGYFDRVALETRQGQFIPDLVLFGSAERSRRVFIEIAVTHFLSDSKRGSGEAIIEIPIATEDDIGHIKAGLLTSEHARFLGFSLAEEMGTDRDCSCGEAEIFALRVYGDGSARCLHTTLGEHATALRQEAETIAYATHDVIGTPRRFDANTRRAVHLKLLARALKAGVRVRDCLMCVHARPNFRLEKARPLWCGEHACAIPHREATSCPDYTPPTGREP